MQLSAVDQWARHIEPCCTIGEAACSINFKSMQVRIMSRAVAQVGGGRRNVSAIFCVQDSTVRAEDVGDRIVGSCFPGDATLDRVDAATGKDLGPVRMDEVAIGDAVRCLVPDGVREGDARDGAQAYLPGICHVAYYLDAMKVIGASCVKG
mgnify:CR=1 FL=1